MAMGRQLWVGIRWIQADKAVCPSVFPDGAWPVVRTLELVRHGQLGAHLADSLPPDLLSLLALLGRAVFGPEPDYLLYTLLVLLVAAQLLAFDTGRLLGGTWAGVLAAILLPMMPDLSALSRQWAAQLPHALLLLTAFDCTLRSRGFTRIAPSLGFIGIVLAGTCLSGWPTDNMLFLTAAGSMAAAATTRSLWLARGPLDDSALSRKRVLAGSAVVCAAVAAGAWLLLFSHTPLGYYVSETRGEQYAATAGRWSWTSLGGYLRLAWSGTLGPLLTCAALAGGVLWAWKGKGRAELGAWLLVPLLLLSVLTKKNSYYAAIVYPTVPLVTALGFALVPWRTLRYPAMALLVLLVWPDWETESFSARTGPLPRLLDFDPAFQTVNPPVLAYRWDDPFERDRAFVAAHADAITSPPRQTLCVITASEFPRLTLALEPVLPDTHFWANLQLGPCDWLLVRVQGASVPPNPEREPSRADIPLDSRRHFEDLPFELVDADVDSDPALWLLHKQH